MENYRKVASSTSAAATAAAASGGRAGTHNNGGGNNGGSSSSSSSAAQAHGECEVIVHAGGKIKTYVDVALRHLQGQERRVVVRGKSKAINKAVTVAEIIKRRMASLPVPAMVIQANQLYAEQETDVWEPIVENLDTLYVTRNLPCISIELIAA
ncbi:hypothetical protein BC831DRAFT_456385 [Entophlyctis helioformis]|nr:hypothetical protein BC831DRAFT_456385 [Entophlyctis helioformis]